MTQFLWAAQQAIASACADAGAPLVFSGIDDQFAAMIPGEQAVQGCCA